ncbi:type I polyketide synthase [Photorhabdus luminescens]|uniref:SDR family NAD(P)-dependent oxidoreductase n=1 Tax=Photorhabdus luminescens subsp. sonorensis TaxID=1173677 RepID=A0A5C4RKP3_PHOLU|nr:type I polyketide synthase [Photorhabdus luminescens]TNH44522.1 SDR family NAD(P)-dependent oxidoreductase [Photorhabdus luminescens subsp. sonorensis]
MNDRKKIAIVGISCRFPGCYNQELFWKLYQEKKSAIVEIPESRWSISKYYSPQFEKNKSLSRWIGLVENFDRFDAPYFNITPREAELMDPQQRISLELAIECLEDSGYGVSDIKSADIGVFLGVCNFDYKERLEKSINNIQGHLSTGTYTTLIPNRISFYLDLKGPSVPVDTACSSSLVALSYAVQAIQAGDCEAAFVGGVSYLFSHTYFVAFSQAGMLSPTGNCKTFDKQADGYVRGEGAGMILIKPLEKALADNDRIYGVIDAVAVNHGGSVATITSPSAYAQANVIRRALQKANISANSISYIESHGTGTPKGDPIEVNGLKRAFRAHAKECGEALGTAYCVISGSKANVGHLESASGMVGLIKGLLSIQKKRLLPIFNLNELNPKISLAGSPFHILTKECDWQPSDGGIRRFGVSSFGFGGVNAHAIISEYQDKRSPKLKPTTHLFAFSASSDKALRAYALLISTFLQNTPLVSVNDCAYTLVRRTNLPYRVAFIYQTRQELLGKIISFANGLAAEVLPISRYPGYEKVADWLNGERDSLKDLFSEGHHQIIYVPPYPFQHNAYFPNELEAKRDEIAEHEKQNGITALYQIEPLFSSVSSFYDGMNHEENKPPIIFSMLGKEQSSILKKRVLPGRYFELPRLSNEASGSDWINWYLNFLKQLISAIELIKPSSWILLSDREDIRGNTLYAHALSLEKEFGLPCGWYQLHHTTLSRHIEQCLKLFQMPVSSSFCRRLNYEIESDALILEALHYHISAFPESAQHCEALSGLKPTVLISGGAGGIGQVFAKYLANTFDANVVIIGRRKCDELPADCMTSEKGTIEYIQADCCNRQALTVAVERIVIKYKNIDLIIHSAGNIEDRSMFFKTEQNVRDIVESKVIGCELLDELTRSLSVKQFIVFSSITALFGNPGQTDYAAANHYLVEFAHNRNRKQSEGLRAGRTTAIYWPYWLGGGMKINESALSMLQETTGTEPLLTDDGIRIFNHALIHQPAELCVVTGVGKRIDNALNSRLVRQPILSDKKRLVSTILSVITDITGLQPADIGLKTRFSDMGIDSIAMRGIAREISQATRFTINNVVLAKNPSIHALVEYLSQYSEKPGNEDVFQHRMSEFLPPSRIEIDEKEVGVIGIDLRMCGSEHWRDSWPLLSNKVLSPEIYPESRWQLLPDELTRDIEREKIQGYFIKDCLSFDHKFFCMSRREAMLMDPQHRTLIESVWSAITDAGYSPDQFNQRRTAVFVCIDANDYALITEFDSLIDEFSIGSSTPYLSANRLSHLFNFKGPSEIVNIACASVYSAIEKAKELISSGVVEQAVVAAAQINLLPSRFKALQKRNLLSADGMVKPFDKDAHGFVRGEGVGCILLKNLKLAVTDGDEVLVKVKSAASWHGGQGDSFTAPDASTHVNVMEMAFRKAHANIEKLQYVEAHGIASNVGDLSEAEAIAALLSKLERASCMVSSMKSNVGHLEVCSGIAGFVRTILAIKHQQIPGISELHELNEGIDSSRLHIKNTSQSFNELRGLIGLLSYGLGGVSAFVLLEPFVDQSDEYKKDLIIEEKNYYFCLSANNVESLKRYVASVIEQIHQYCHITPLSQLISTLRFYRKHLDVRLVVKVSNYEELLSKLEAFLAGHTVDGLQTSVDCQDDDVMSAALPETLRIWLKKKEGDEGMRPPVDKRSFWPKYPFDRSLLLYIAPKYRGGKIPS